MKIKQTHLETNTRTERVLLSAPKEEHLFSRKVCKYNKIAQQQASDEEEKRSPSPSAIKGNNRTTLALKRPLELMKSFSHPKVLVFCPFKSGKANPKVSPKSCWTNDDGIFTTHSTEPPPPKNRTLSKTYSTHESKCQTLLQGEFVVRPCHVLAERSFVQSSWKLSLEM